MIFQKHSKHSEDHFQAGVYTSLEEMLLIGRKARGFSFLPSASIYSILAGPHASKLRGRGMDFEELKKYVHGDSTRDIDWKATQRSGKSYVRIYNEEKDRCVWLIVSQRASMFFGSRGMFKSVAAAHAAALGLFRALDQGDRVGAVVYNDRELKVFKPHKMEKNAIRILDEVAHQNRQLHANIKEDVPEQLNRALEIVSSQSKHDDLIVLIGDGSSISKESVRLISDLNGHDDILAVFISDPAEERIDPNGSLLFTDSTAYLDVNTSEHGFSRKFREVFAEKKRYLAEASIKRAIPIVHISTHDEVLKQLQTQLGNVRARQVRSRLP